MTGGTYKSCDAWLLVHAQGAREGGRRNTHAHTQATSHTMQLPSCTSGSASALVAAAGEEAREVDEEAREMDEEAREMDEEVRDVDEEARVIDQA